MDIPKNKTRSQRQSHVWALVEQALCCRIRQHILIDNLEHSYPVISASRCSDCYQLGSMGLITPPILPGCCLGAVAWGTFPVHLTRHR